MRKRLGWTEPEPTRTLSPTPNENFQQFGIYSMEKDGATGSHRPSHKIPPFA